MQSRSTVLDQKLSPAIWVREGPKDLRLLGPLVFLALEELQKINENVANAQKTFNSATLQMVTLEFFEVEVHFHSVKQQKILNIYM